MSLLMTKSDTSVDSSELEVYKKSENGGYIGYLFNQEVDTDQLGLSPVDYIYLSVSPKLYVQGELYQSIKASPISVKGANSFVLQGLDTDHYKQLVSFYGLQYIEQHPELVGLLEHRDANFLDIFLEEFDEYEGDDQDIEPLWKIFDEIVEQTGEDYDIITLDVKYQLMYKKLGLSIEINADSKTIIGVMDDTELSNYIKYKEVLSEEMEELQNGEFDFAYSNWEGDYNLELYSDLEIDNGDYISYPSLYYDADMIEPETGEWYPS
jgi:hypothetical protein